MNFIYYTADLDIFRVQVTGNGL